MDTQAFMASMDRKEAEQADRVSLNDIFLGKAEDLVKLHNIHAKDLDEVVGHEDLLIIYPSSYEQFSTMVNEATKLGIKDSFRETVNRKNGQHYYQLVVKR